LYSIRPAIAADEAAWRAMWDGYCTFYEVAISASVTDVNWARILDPQSAVNAILAFDERGAAVGFANYILHPYTWSDQPACYLEDLFVAPEVRGGGAGHALITHLFELSRALGWSRLYWTTRETNATARRLYDRFSPADGFIRYTLSP
jgi:GNAT superfamily N-acetyltransferase